MACNVKTSRAKTRAHLINNGVIDKYNTILDYVQFGNKSADAENAISILNNLDNDRRDC